MKFGDAGASALTKAAGSGPDILTQLETDSADVERRVSANRRARAIGTGLNLSRTALFEWTAAILFANQLFAAIKESSSLAPSALITNLIAIGTFQYLAWYAIFRLLAAGSATSAASRRDWLVALTVCLLLFTPTARVIWVAATAAGLYLLVRNEGDRKLRAAGVVLLALASQELWGHLLFELIASPLLHAEAVVVGISLRAMQSGAVWQDNIVTGQSGDGIVINPYCSSFHNLALALLCWVTIVHLKRDGLTRSDVAKGAAIGAAMVLLNIVRLVLMAINIDFYHFWHDGPGAEIFAIGASLAALLFSLYGVRRRPA
jgi:hypothetical protein